MSHEYGYYWNNGDFYYGQWNNNQVHGFGIYISNLTIIYGQFQYGLLNGYCCFINSQQIKIANFINGELNGQVKKILSNGTYEMLNYGLTNSEQILNNIDMNYFSTLMQSQLKYVTIMNEYTIYGGCQKHQLGLIVHKVGRFEFGNLVNRQVNGMGAILFETGDKYIGQFENGMLQGLGVFYNNSTIQYTQGRFKNNEMIEILKQSESEIVFRGKWHQLNKPQLTINPLIKQAFQLSIVKVQITYHSVTPPKQQIKPYSTYQSTNKHRQYSSNITKFNDFSTHFKQNSRCNELRYRDRKEQHNYYSIIHGKSMQIDDKIKQQLIGYLSNDYSTNPEGILQTPQISNRSRNKSEYKND